MNTHSDSTRDFPAIDAAFPGGNIRVLGCEGAEVRLAPDLRDTVGRWFYWHFRATFPCAGTWRFTFDAAAVGTRGPAVRRNGERAYLVGIDDERTRPAMEHFGELLEKHCPPEAPYFASDTLPFGVGWNNGASYAQGMPLAAWSSLHQFVRFGRSLEIPFANFREKTQTPETIRAFGRGVAAALADYASAQALLFE